MKKQRLCAAVMMAAVLMLTGCGGNNGLADKHTTAAELTGAVENNTGEALLTKGTLSLYLDADMAVRVTDSATGAVWSTNGDGLTGEGIREQFRLSYYTANAAYSEMSSLEDSVEKEQVRAFVEQDTLYVEYRLGDFAYTYADVPNTISEERFQKCFLDKLSADEAEEFKKYYKDVPSEGCWMLRPKGRNSFMEIMKVMDRVGYTAEDLAQDHGMYGLSAGSGVRPQFTVVLAYELTEDGLHVCIPADRITFSAAYPLYEIQLLPWFGRQSQQTDGYILLPDGSGALMRFSAAFDDRTELSVPVYGLDYAVNSDTLTSGQYCYEQASLPVFGMKDGDQTYFAVIDGAPSKATVKAHPAGAHHVRNAAYVSFRMVNKDSIYLSGSDNSSKVVVFESALSEETCGLTYHFLAPDSGYEEMAAYYRTVLTEQGTLTPLAADTKVSMLVETVGAVMTKKNTLGVSYEGLVAATTYEQTAAIAADLKENGVEALNLRLLGWFNGGYYHAYPSKVKLIGTLGGKTGWNALRRYADEAGVGLYPDVDFQNTAKNGNGFFATLGGARRLDASEAKRAVLSRALLLEKNDIGLTPTGLYMVSPAKFTELAGKFIRSFSSVKTGGLSLRSTGAELYSDFRSDATVDRPCAQRQVTEQMKLLSAEYDLLANGSGAYILGAVDKLAGIAVDSSHYKTADETIPFLQMVLHGSKEMYVSPVNLASDGTAARLRAIAYGAQLSYQVTYADSDILKNSEYTDNFASGYFRWREDMIEGYGENAAALRGLMGCTVSGFRQVAPDVTCTVYGDGTEIYVNYGKADYTADGVTVPAEGYLRRGGETR